MEAPLATGAADPLSVRALLTDPEALENRTAPDPRTTMARTLLTALLIVPLAEGVSLRTEYAAETAMRVEVESRFTLETVDFSMERDGEPVEGGFGGGPTVDERRTLAMVDSVLEAADGSPRHVRRTFETIEGSAFMVMGDREMESSSECPLSGVVLDLTVEDGEVGVEVTEGSEPDDEKVLEGHAPGLALDALLPDGEVEPGASWEVEGEALCRALGFDLEHAYFPPPSREDGGEEGGRGRRGGRGMRGGGGAARYFVAGEWEVELTLGEATVEHEGVACHAVTIEAEASGELPEREFGGGGRGRGDRALAPPAGMPALENSFEIELEGTLYISVADHRPVHLEVKAELTAESTREMQRRDSQMVISSSQEGTLEYTVDVSSAEFEDEE